jgi:hypothetical protein
MKTAKTLTLALLTIGLAAIGCSTTPSDSDGDSDNLGGSGGGGSDSDSGTGGAGTDSDTDSGTGAHNGSGGSNGTGGSNGSGGEDGLAGSGNGTGGLPTDIEFEYDPSLDMEPETCADVEISSEEIFLDIFVILDRSGSMTQPFGNSDSDGYCDIGQTNVGSRWCNAINSLYGFFSDPTTVGTGFSYGEFSSSKSGCGPFAMDVEFGVIEANDGNNQLANLVTELNDNNPDGFTATEEAMDTLIAETSAHTASGTRRTIGILITDGDPFGGCDTNVNNLNALIANHYTATGIPTYIIGMTGATADNLEGMAVGAGAEPHTDYCDPSDTSCSYYSVGDGNPAAFKAALDSIRKSELGCEYAVPNAEIGVGNLDTLSVVFTPDTGETPIDLVRVGNETTCTDDDEYWVDVGVDDSIIKLCPATCDLRGDGASVDISLKCEGS